MKIISATKKGSIHKKQECSHKHHDQIKEKLFSGSNYNLILLEIKMLLGNSQGYFSKFVLSLLSYFSISQQSCKGALEEWFLLPDGSAHQAIGLHLHNIGAKSLLNKYCANRNCLYWT